MIVCEMDYLGKKIKYLADINKKAKCSLYLQRFKSLDDFDNILASGSPL